MGGFSPSWPLTKVLDIGGVERRPQFSDSSLSSTGKQYMACFHPVLQKVHSTEGNYYMYIGFVMDLSAICRMFSQYHSVVHNLLHHFLPCLPPSPSSPAYPEVPPIPCHVHAGEVREGRCVGHGKTEAYFFPPLDVPPYNLKLGPVKTRLGLRPDVTREKASGGIDTYIHIYI